MTAEQAFDQHHEAVFRFAYRMTRRPDIAEDITQDCFLAYVRAPERFSPRRGTLKTYLFSIARNLVLKRYRDGRAEVLLEEDDLPVRNRNEAFDVGDAVERAVAALSPLQQEALVLFEYEGFTIEEIAGIAGTDGATVKSRLHRARERLKKSLAPYRPVGGVRGTAG